MWSSFALHSRITAVTSASYSCLGLDLGIDWFIVTAKYSFVLLCLQVVEKALQRSMSRMQVDALDCVQFHWWDYKDKRYLHALGHLSDLQKEGVIRMRALILPMRSSHR